MLEVECTGQHDHTVNGNGRKGNAAVAGIAQERIFNNIR